MDSYMNNILYSVQKFTSNYIFIYLYMCFDEGTKKKQSQFIYQKVA